MASRKPKVTAEEAVRFPKEKILTFQKYYNRIDLITALLEDGEEYSEAEVDQIMNQFLKEEVE